MTIPPLRFVPDSPAPQPRKWNGGIRIVGRIIIAVNDDGSQVPIGDCLLAVAVNGTIDRLKGVNPSLGFQLDGEGRIMLSASDPLMQPRAEPAATVDGMSPEQLDECLARLHWGVSPMAMYDPHPMNWKQIATLTAPAYSRWLERTARTGKGVGNGA